MHSVELQYGNIRRLNMENLISILGSIASIGGALWAIYEAKKASKSATKAELVRDEMIQQRQIIEVSQVHFETNRVLRVVSKVGPSCNSKLLRGINCMDIAKEVEEYSRFINEQSAHFGNIFENKAIDLCKDIKNDIESLSEAVTFEDKKRTGTNIYYKIYDFIPIVKQLSDNKKERATENI